MKSTFTACLVAAVAFADASLDQIKEIEQEIEREVGLLEGMLQKTEDGRLQLTLPQLPQISFSDDQATVDAWKAEKEAAYAAIDDAWAAAWSDYQQQVAQPWNDFVTTAEDLRRQGDELDLKTTEEAVTYIASNTFVDGMALIDLFPEIESFLMEMREQAMRDSEQFNLEQLRVPQAMRRVRNAPDGQLLFKAAPVKLQYADSVYDGTSTVDEYYYEEGPSELEMQLEQLAGQALDAAMTYGFDPQVASEWIQRSQQEWDELSRRHEQEEGELAETQIQEASGYIKGILDNAMPDIKAAVEAAIPEIEAAVDQQVAEIEGQVDAAAQGAIEGAVEALDEAFAAIDGASPDDVAEIVDEINLAQEAAQEGGSSGAVYGLVGCGVALAAGALLYKRRQQKDGTVVQPLLAKDTDFYRV